MPITDKGTVDYHIPEEIKSKFTKEILSDFRKEVIRTFQKNDIKRGDKPNNYEEFSYHAWWLYMEGTSGYCEAFRKIMLKHNLREIVDYYDSLPYYDSDLFDHEFGDLLIQYGLVKLGSPDEIN
ncbi:hypothetical protein [Guptibacillus spartinae]|uniref:hypothetical protein n=1 Tax=Guptibacillus spartinae TaxID=3025679 RepID=UPI00235E1619|nr:hypothetical protein [Pseudalkalibacillus spartinae]